MPVLCKQPQINLCLLTLVRINISILAYKVTNINLFSVNASWFGLVSPLLLLAETFYRDTYTQFPDSIQQLTIFYNCCIYISTCWLMSTTNVWRPSEQVCVTLDSSYRWESNSLVVKIEEVDTHFRYCKHALQRILPSPIKQNNQCIYQINHTLKFNLFLNQTVLLQDATKTLCLTCRHPIDLRTHFS